MSRRQSRGSNRKSKRSAALENNTLGSGSALGSTLGSKTSQQHIILPWDSPKWSIIKEKLVTPIVSVVDMDSRLVSLHNGKVKSRTLIDFFNKYSTDTIKDSYSTEIIIEKIFPLIQSLILKGKELFADTPLITLVESQNTTNITLTRPQVACLVACAWFGLFTFYGVNYISTPRPSKSASDNPNTTTKLRDFSKYGFIDMYTSGNTHALQCILHYFMRVDEYINNADVDVVDLFNASNIIYHRRKLSVKPNFTRCSKQLCQVELGGPIDAFPENIYKVNFSTKYICSGGFKDTLNYEEIMFLTHPECIPAILITSHLSDLESLIILGTEKMSTVGGFGTNARYESKYTTEPNYGFNAEHTSAMIKSAIVCIDASANVATYSQLVETFDRDLLKAFCGFSAFNFDNNIIMTGHWSSFMFNGNIQLKFIQQLLAASASDKSIVYYITAHDFEERVDDFVKFIEEEELTVGELYVMYKRLIEKCIKTRARISELDIFEALMDMDIPEL